MPVGDHYTVQEWKEITESASFDQVDDEQLGRVHLRWIWADHAKRTFEEALTSEGWDDIEVWTGRVPWAMFVWYGLLYVVVEGFTARQIILSESPLSLDVEQIRQPLRDARDATFHVDRDHGYYDPRFVGIVSESADQVRRVHQSLGQLALDEKKRRRLAQGEDAI
jgi:hypothetical protein